MLVRRSSTWVSRSPDSPPAEMRANADSSSETRRSSAAIVSGAGAARAVPAGAPRDWGSCSSTSIFPRPFELISSVAPFCRRSRTVRMNFVTASCTFCTSCAVPRSVLLTMSARSWSAR